MRTELVELDRGQRARQAAARRAYRVEEDVGGLEVPVDDLLLRRVQEGQAARRADGDLEPRAPRQRLRCAAPCAKGSSPASQTRAVTIAAKIPKENAAAK